MTPQEFKRALDLYSDVRELPESAWAAAADSVCAGNAGLRAELMRLLYAERSASRGCFLGRPALEEAERLLSLDYNGLPDPGTMMGRYRIRAPIAAGGMGIVYEAYDERLERRVALKVLPFSSPFGENERVRRFEREARVLSQLNHPNIVSIFDADFDKGCYFIAMEFVEGQTLRSLIADRKSELDTKALLDIVSQAAAALAAAHAAGIVHCDIKPENVMLRPDALVKVLDFGLAAICEPTAIRDVGQFAGTVRYLSPEQVAGNRATPRSDLFSLGVVAYELAAGVRPFDGPTDGTVFDAIMNLAPQPPSNVRPAIGPELDRLIMAALEKDPDLRYQTASDLHSACRRLMGDFSRTDGCHRIWVASTLGGGSTPRRLWTSRPPRHARRRAVTESCIRTVRSCASRRATGQQAERSRD